MTSQPPRETTATLPQRIGWAALIVITLAVCYFSHLGVIGFVGPDEPRYAWIARDMAESGDWVTPRLYGKPWFEKPPLLYWGGAGFFHLMPSEPEVAARLPSAVSALLATLALAWLAWRSYGQECARWLLLLLPTSVGMIGFSHAAATDMLFAGMITIAMVCAAVVLGFTEIDENPPILPQTPWLALLLFGFFLGLAVLAKGPAAIILSGGTVFLWAVFTKRWRDAFRLVHPAAIVSFSATALPWYILCARRNPDFFRIFIIEHNFKRYLTPEFQHLQPFWFYIPVALAGIAPWLVLLPALIIDTLGSLRRWRSMPDPFLAFLICWFVFPFAFFSASKSKLPGYVLPALFPLLLLIVKSIAPRFTAASRNRWVGLTSSFAILAMGGLVFFSARYVPFATDYTPQPLRWLFLVITFLGLLAIVMGLRRMPKLGLTLCVLAVLLSFESIGYGDAKWALDQGLSAGLTGAQSQEIDSRFPASDVYVYKLRRSLRYSLNFYFHRELPDWAPESRRHGLVFTSAQGSDELRKVEWNCPFYIARPAVVACQADPLRPLLNGLGEGRETK
jgi:4-amino-4-deoxy-L-arabinose transferase-like glycosyltransferase